MRELEKYDLIDFINDKSFTNWVVKPTEDNNQYWLEFLKKYPEKQHDINIATIIIQNTSSKNKLINEKKAEVLWLKIKASTLSNKNKKRMLYYFSAAAGFLILISIGFWQFHFKLSTKSDIDYSNIAPPVIINNQVQLILADQSRMFLVDDEPTLMYQSDGSLHTSNQEIDASKSANDINSVSSIENEKVLFNQILVPRGKRSSIIFNDGTKLWLNSGSRAIYPVVFTGSRREIYIEGEAFLEVSQNKSMPFIVKTNNLEVKVLGTSFNIKAYPEEEISSIVLVEGHVNIKTDLNHSVELKPEQMYQYSAQTGLSATASNIDIFEHIGWKFGWLLCSSENLGSVFTKLMRYYNIEIITQDPIVNKYKITGKLELQENLNDVMKAVSIASSVDYKIVDEKKIIITKKMKVMN